MAVKNENKKLLKMLSNDNPELLDGMSKILGDKTNVIELDNVSVVQVHMGHEYSEQHNGHLASVDISITTDSGIVRVALTGKSRQKIQLSTFAEGFFE